MTDPRLLSTVFVRAAGRTVALMQPIGGDAAAPNEAIRKVAAAVQSFVVHASDIRQGTAGPLQQGQEIARSAGPLAASLNDAAATIAKAHSRVAAAAATSAVTPWSQGTAPYWQVQTSLALATKLAAMPANERARTLASIRAEPGANTEWLHALLNTPPALSSVTPAERASLHRVAFEALKPSEFASLSVEMQQLDACTQAMRAAIDLAAELGAPRTGLIAGPVAELFTLAPLAWAPARED